MNFEWIKGVEAVNLTSSLAIGGSDATEETPATVAVSTNRGATHTTSKNRNSVLEDQLVHDQQRQIFYLTSSIVVNFIFTSMKRKTAENAQQLMK